MIKKYIKFEAILFEFVEPMVVLYKAGKTFFVGTALPSNVGYVTDYLLVTVTPKIFKRYAREDVDLRYLFVSSPSRTFWNLKASELGKPRVQVQSVDESTIVEEMLPESQFFASSHSSEYAEINHNHGSEETLFIDGNWEMEDFGSFSRKFRDLYSFEDSLNKFQDNNTPQTQKKRIIGAFQNNTLHGGGSYVGLFGDLTRSIPANDRYELKKVQYASPGEIRLQGKGTIFDALENHIKNMVGSEHIVHGLYKNLYDFMSKKKLLDVSHPVINITQQDRSDIENRTKDLFLGMGFSCYDTIDQLTKKDKINNAKISLALYRRLKEASSYFAEGRASYER